MKRIFTSLLCGLMTTAAFAQWSPTSMQGEKIRTASNVKSYYSLDLNAMRSKLANAQETGSNAVPVEIKLPTLNGKIERFAVYSSPVVVKSIADRYQLGSYVGIGIDDPNAIVRFSVAPNDFQSMVVRNGNYEFIEPQNTAKSVYGVHPKTNKTEEDKAFVCSTSETPLTKAQMDKLYMSGKTFTNNPTDFSKASDKKYRTMRLAMTTNGEYTQYFGGVAGAMTAINATLTRCNGVFEMDFGLHLILQDFPALIYPDPATDPYSTSLSSWNLAAQKAITAVAGEANYDIGHMFGASGGGGNAGCIGCVCISPPLNGSGVPTANGKGSGITSPADGIPMGDNFDIDYVAHEIGHQLGANHTFSMSLEGTGQNVEPGSGSTIMGYAGITSQNVQQHSDAYFHINSIIQVQNNLIAKTCDIETSVNNNPPVITAMADVTIPKGTAFVLTAQATDQEGDPMTYTWEQVDNASSGTTITNLGTLTSGPTFRSWTPTTNPTRYFPKLSTVLAGNLKNNADWEAVSTVARTTNFRVTVRDNNADIAQKQTQSALQKVTVHANGPFKVTSTTLFNDNAKPFLWDVVGTNAAPFNVANVKIDYTTDNGATWAVLAESTPNDGSEDLQIALPSGTPIKVRVSAIGNVFYAIGSATVSKTPTAAPNCATLTSPANNAMGIVYTTPLNLTWTAPVGGEPAELYDVYLGTTADPTTLIATVSTTSYSVSNLSASTQYYWKVVPKNAFGSASGCTTVYTFTTTDPTYCTAGATSTSFEKISNVTFADINKSSTSTAGYEDFTSVVGNVTKTSSYTFTASFTGTSYSSDEVRVWIDFNQDKDFDDEGELVLVTPKKLSPWTGTIEIPATANTGTTRMRVRLHDSSLGGNVNPCGTSTYGQVEDYTLIIGTLATGENSLSNVQVYPNPAADILNVSKVSNNALYAIYNVSGQLIAKGKITDNKVSVSKLQAGVYIISVEDKGNVEKVKFIKK
ncbi:MAG: T9SS type A sorting domain-containing protein [Flavobacteriia bacterium]|nr:T9SS type A sorting domain-containing protein [Flavobacteriia bacterium]MBH2023883.1 T9SS type A sorting domain-containing protein [Flavobacteriales bacterium]